MARARQIRNKLNGGGSSGALVYPSNLGEFGGFIEFRRLNSKNSAIGRPVQLYMPAQPKQTLNADYDIETIGILNNIKSGMSLVESIKGMEGFDMDSIKKLASTQGVDIAKIVGLSVGSETDISKAIRASARVTLNPSMTYLFKQMGHRTFSFSFLMKPTSAQESNNIRDIIRELKTAQTPEAKGAADRFLSYPDTIQATYKTAGENGGYLHKFKPAVIQTIDVTYSTDGETWTQFSDGAPTSVQLDITIQELSTITRSDVEEGY